VLSTIDDTFTFDLGEYELFKIELPGYATSFNFKNLEFTGTKQGDFSVVPGDDVAVIVKKIENILPW